MKTPWNELAKARMKQVGITQDKLAEALGKTQGAIGHWLNGRREPSIEDIAAVMKQLGLKELILSSDGMVIAWKRLMYGLKPPLMRGATPSG